MINKNHLVPYLMSQKWSRSGRIKGFEISQAALPTFLLACTNKSKYIIYWWFVPLKLLFP